MISCIIPSLAGVTCWPCRRAYSMPYSSFFPSAAASISIRLSHVWICSLSSTLVLLILSLATGSALTGYSPRTYLVFLAAALLPQLAGYLAMGYALGHLPASIVSPTMLGQPVLTALLAIPLLGENASACPMDRRAGRHRRDLPGPPQPGSSAAIHSRRLIFSWGNGLSCRMQMSACPGCWSGCGTARRRAGYFASLLRAQSLCVPR